MSHIEWTSGFPPLVEKNPYLVYIDNVQRPGIGKAITYKIGDGWFLELNLDRGILGKHYPFQNAIIRAWSELNEPILGDQNE